MAKIAAGEAALDAATTSLQVHGAIGYTWEQDLHVWMRRAWSLDLAWGDDAWHRERVADAVIDGHAARGELRLHSRCFPGRLKDHARPG